MICYHCHKGIIHGRSHTHRRGVAGGRWKKRAQKTPRLFVPNLQPILIMKKGKVVRVKLCTKCIKRIKKDVKDGVRPFLSLLQYEKKKEKKVEVKEEKKEGKVKKVKTSSKKTTVKKS